MKKTTGKSGHDQPAQGEPDDLLEQAHQAVAAQLRAERGRRKIKQADISLATGIHVTTLSKIEQGHTTMSLDQLFKIASALGIEPGDFLNAAQRELGK